jgi:integrase
MRVHLTDIVVQRLQKPGSYFDETTPGFGIRVGKARKTWVIMRGQIRQRMRIGHYPAVSLAEARKQAKKLLTEAPTRNPAMSFATAYEDYKLSIASLRPKTEGEYKRFLDKYFVPRIGRKRLAELQYENITACVHEAAPSEAAHALAVCRTFLRWCVRPPRRYLTHSPLEGVQVKVGRKRKRMLKPAELKTVWRAAEKQGYPYGTILQLLIAMGQRRGETANLRWPWINETDRTITLPETVTKNHKEHTYPYGDLVAAILETIPRRNSTDLLFPSAVSEKRPLSGWSKFKANLGDGLPAWRLHDLRRTFRTTHAEIGTPAEIAERLINHAAAVQTDVESIYDVYHYLPQMQEAVLKFDDHLKALFARSP